MERFDHYMERCLYGSDGFYRSHGSAGRSRGDFITSPEVGPLFGAVVANALDAWWESAGRPDPWFVYDVGCGPGTLLRSIRRARPVETRPWTLIGVDRAGPPDPVGTPSGDGELLWTSALPDDLGGAVVLGNELIDNMPFRIVVRTAGENAETSEPEGEWWEVHVRDGAEVLEPTDARLDIPPGTRAPLLDSAAAWIASVLDRGLSHVCLFDYGAWSTRELAERGGWLRTYRRHEQGADPYHEPGRWDITTDIAVDQLPSAGVVSDQREFLRQWGIDEFVRQGREYWRAHAARPDLTAIAMRSRVAEAEALTDPAGLGSWLVWHYAESWARPTGAAS